MWGQKNEDEFFWPSNDAFLQRRRAVKERPGHHRVNMGRKAFIKGWVVVFGIWSLVSLVIAFFGSLLPPVTLGMSLWGIVLMVSFIVALLLGTPLALLIEYVLRLVTRQWIHVLAFGVIFCLFGMGIACLLSPDPLGGFHLVLGGIVGVAAGIGRFSIRHDTAVFGAVTTLDIDPRS